MKVSDKPTAHILVQANTNSEWDYSEFAIIHITEQWKQKQSQRLEYLKLLQGGSIDLASVRYLDTAVDFYRTDKNDNPNTEAMLNGKAWVFVKFDQDEQETFAVPENCLGCYRLVLLTNSTGYYTAYSKHTNEEFWTEDFDLQTICNPTVEETELERFCRERFQHLSNAQLIARINRAPDFGWDDEGVEINRRKKVSNGKFDYEFRGNTIVILKDDQL